MSALEPGRVCVLTRGADAGKEVVVKQVVDENYVIIVGARVKERRANITHLEPTPRKTTQIPAGPAPRTPRPAKPAAGDTKIVEKIVRKVKKEAKEQAA